MTDESAIARLKRFFFGTLRSNAGSRPVAVRPAANDPIEQERLVGEPGAGGDTGIDKEGPHLVSTAAALVDSINLKARGHVDSFAASRISGWAYYIGKTDAPMLLNIYFDGILVGQAAADVYRRDLERAGHGNGRHGFEFAPPPGLFAQSKTIEVRALNGQIIGSFKNTKLSAGGVTA